MREVKGREIDDRTFAWRISFMTDQVAGIFNSLKHVARGAEEFDSANRAMAKTEVGDLIVQTQLLCDLVGLDFEECEELGWDRYNESKKEWEKKGKGEKWR